MYSTKFRAVSQDYRFALFFQHGIDHIGTHHIATGESSFRLPAINTNKCFAEMYLLDALACPKGQPYFRFFSGTRHRAK
ncbi:Uncharacterised protein [Escherichia coli]|uniref:Uncharacterized protein n=1 Tax=Escherichia coli TaxID=562 RepID=A0A376TG93_ECOLX|nr:Uncharacterised protein [Escherichia coli]